MSLCALRAAHSGHCKPTCQVSVLTSVLPLPRGALCQRGLVVCTLVIEDDSCQMHLVARKRPPERAHSIEKQWAVLVRDQRSQPVCTSCVYRVIHLFCGVHRTSSSLHRHNRAPSFLILYIFFVCSSLQCPCVSCVPVHVRAWLNRWRSSCALVSVICELRAVSQPFWLSLVSGLLGGTKFRCIGRQHCVSGACAACCVRHRGRLAAGRRVIMCCCQKAAF